MTSRTRISQLDWQAVEKSLWTQGYATLPRMLTAKDCAALIHLYAQPARFRKRVNMAQHRFGIGEYQYFADPLPRLVTQLRTQAYPPLARIANRWMAALKQPETFPPTLSRFLTLCQEQGQLKPTPLLLYYEQDGYNCLHQDVYGPIAFPLQMTFCLSCSQSHYTGGEFLLVEQRPRAQARGIALTLQQGEGIIFTTRYRPARGTRGYYRMTVRHGVSTVTAGQRYTLGIIFHNAL